MLSAKRGVGMGIARNAVVRLYKEEVRGTTTPRQFLGTLAASLVASVAIELMSRQFRS